MDSVLNLGMNDAIMENLAVTLPGATRRFALDVYRRFLRNFGSNVLGAEDKQYDAVEERIKKREGVNSLLKVSESGLEEIIREFKTICPIPMDPQEQLFLAIEAAFTSLHTHK